MKVKTRVRLVIVTMRNAVARALYRSLKPDNTDFPPGLSMRMNVNEERLILDVVSDGNMDSLISTVSEILEHVQTSLETFRKTVTKDA